MDIRTSRRQVERLQSCCVLTSDLMKSLFSQADSFPLQPFPHAVPIMPRYSFLFSLVFFMSVLWLAGLPCSPNVSKANLGESEQTEEDDDDDDEEEEEDDDDDDDDDYARYVRYCWILLDIVR